MSKSLREALSAEVTNAVRRERAAPKVLAKLRDEIDENDGYPTSVIGASPPGPGAFKLYKGTCQDWQFIGTTKVRCEAERPCPEHDSRVPMTTVESAAGKSGHLRAQHDQLTVAWWAHVKTGAHFDLLLAAHLERIDIEREKCNLGTRRDGVIEWGNPLCQNVAAMYRGGLCDTCAGKERTWRKEHGFPSRAESAA